MIKQLLTSILFVFYINTYSQAFTENFDNITTLTGNGWFMQNNSTPIGGIPNWFQGTPTTATPTPGPFDAYNGAANAYIAANYNFVSGNNTISGWLLTPNRTFRNGDVITFYARSTNSQWSDRLQVRMSTNGASTNVGTGSAAVGDFTTLLLDINPTQIQGVFLNAWTLYTITISGLPAPTSGRIAFRYYVIGGGSGADSDYIGLDNVNYTPYVCPTFTMTPGGALSGGTAGSAYSTTLTQTGALGAPNFSVTAGALPPGLTLSASGTISGTPTATGTFNFTVTVSDASGCSGSQSYSITVVCTANPITFSTAPSLCSSDSPYTLIEGSPAGGTYSGTGVSGGQFDPAAGTQTITYDYTDPYGCAHSSNYLITVNTTPTVTLAGGTLANGHIGSPYTASFGQSGGSGTPSFTISAGSVPDGMNLSTSGTLSGTPTEYGIFNFTVTVSDDNLCSGGEDYLLEIEDCPLPGTSITDFEAQCSVSLSDLTVPSMDDSCGNTITPTTNATFPITAQGTTVITWSYTEMSGNVVTKNQNIIIDDTTDPVPTVATLTNITAQCQVTSGDVATPTATDNCSGTVTVTNDATFPITTQGTTVITWTYEDINGNTTTQTQNVVIDDTTDPVPTVANLPNITAQCEITSGDVTEPSATDNCSGTVTVSNDATFPITAQGTTVITWTYEDVNGNTTMQTQNVVITDTTDPVPAVANLPNITAQCEITSGDVTAPTATDNCGGTIIVNNDATFPITTQGTTVITWTYEDANGNTTTQTQNVIIDDTTGPVPTVATLPNITGQCEVTSSDVTEPAATDNCSGSVTVTNDAIFPITTQGTTVITWTYEDVNGNTTTQTQNVIVEDDQDPTIDTEEVTLSLQGSGTAILTIEMVEDWVADNCGVESIELSQENFDCDDLGSNTVTITVIDINGNSTQEDFNVTINDPENLCDIMSVSDMTKAEFTVYPNPARHNVYVKAPENVSIQRIIVYSLSGERIQDTSYTSKLDQYEVDLNKLDAGTYILRIESSAGIYTKRILVKG